MSIHTLCLRLLLFFLFCFSSSLSAETTTETQVTQEPIETLESRLTALEERVKSESAHIEASLATYLLESSALERETKYCEEEQLKKIENLEASLAILEGESERSNENEDANTEATRAEQKSTVTPELKDKKDELLKEKKAIEKELSHCRILLVQAKKVSKQLEEARTSYLRTHLLHREQSLATHINQVWQTPRILQQNSLNIAALLSPYLYWDKDLSRLVVILGLAFILGIGLRFRYKDFTTNQQDCTACASPLLYATQRYLIIFSPWLLSSLSVWFFMAFSDSSRDYSFLQQLSEQITLAVMALIFLRGLARVEQSKDWVSNVGEGLFQKLSFWARWVIIFGSISLLFYHTFNALGDDNTLVALVRHCLILVLSLLLGRLLWILVRIQPLLNRLHLRFFGLLLLLTALGAHFMGYYNLSVFLLYGFSGTLMTLTGFAYFYRIFNEFIDSFQEGRTRWQMRLREKLKLAPEAPFPGLLWIRLSTILTLFLFFGAILLYIWGLSDQSLNIVIEHLFDEFSIGGLNLQFSQLLMGAFVLVVLLNLFRLLQVQLRDNWLKNTAISHSAREASSTLFGYFGVTLSILVGLSVSGVNLSSFAFIAGALSIGIGFGLQNVVNNFVSGLILLFERPIRRGDWVKINSTEGYVKAIKIRSTIIQTFDRSDIVVPNSELISNEITNYFLDDRYGRIIVPVGVAYGSNPHEVIKILEECGRRHKKITKDHPDYYLKAFFMGFGDNALNFELRCFTYNIDSKLSIKSDLGLMIYDALNEAGLSIPFPQRDVHVYRNDLGSSE